MLRFLFEELYMAYLNIWSLKKRFLKEKSISQYYSRRKMPKNRSFCDSKFKELNKRSFLPFRIIPSAVHKMCFI